MTVHIAPASATEIEECAHLIALALRDDPVLKAFVPGERDRANRLTVFFCDALREGAFLTGVVDVARREPGGDIIGVAAWEGPGQRQRLRDLFGEFSRQVRASGINHAPNLLAQLVAYARARPRYPHWYLADIAVDGAARGLGIGSALLTHRLAEIDAQAAPAYLEATAPDNQRLYERFGFRSAGPIGKGSVTAVAMIRSPQ
ncbi:GNAT family N-acetyltransferase [Streptomyces sp. NPDC005732]|uniref:GNAT family N-acetyltransferase n=1 Tax=Streptomyces sp. NPDC005732 TaxID=3157057 RepID=UPI0033F73F79